MDNRVITRTSKEAMALSKKSLKNSTCPECKRVAHSNTTSSKTVMTGLFSAKTVRTDSYTCFDCGCKWKVRRGQE